MRIDQELLDYATAVARQHMRGPWLSFADDVAQEAILRVLHAKRRFDPSKGTLKQFIWPQVRWAAFDLMRQEAAFARKRANLDHTLTHETPETFLERASRAELSVKVAEIAFASWGERDKPAAEASVRWVIIDDVPSKDVSKMLRLHPSNVSRARQKELQRLRGLCIARGVG